MEDRPQFGLRTEPRDYADRPTAFGIAERDGKIAVARVTNDENTGMDVWVLPGGAIDEGEDAKQAVAREFGEETALRVRAVGEPFARANQYEFKTSKDRASNNLAEFFEMEIEGEDPSLKKEGDHRLVFLDPLQAMVGMKLDYHAWAVAAWLRRRRR